jgi:hypothetical protein
MRARTQFDQIESRVTLVIALWGLRVHENLSIRRFASGTIGDSRVFPQGDRALGCM